MLLSKAIPNTFRIHFSVNNIQQNPLFRFIIQGNFGRKVHKMERRRCLLGVIPVRKEPSDKSEMISQIIFGESAIVLDQNEKWFMIQTNHDGYEGWVDKKQLLGFTDEVFDGLITSLYAVAQMQDSEIVIPAGSIIPSNMKDFKLIQGVQCKAGEYTPWKDIAKTAQQFVGVPYLWGGRTCLGIDCSGFTQTVFRLLGKNIKRDAYQQAEQGEPITFIEEAQTGDLAFFDNSEGRITHVGIILREDSDIMIIHASGKVRLDALDHQGIFNRETGEYSHQLRLIKRI